MSNIGPCFSVSVAIEGRDVKEYCHRKGLLEVNEKARIRQIASRLIYRTCGTLEPGDLRKRATVEVTSWPMPRRFPQGETSSYVFRVWQLVGWEDD